MSDRKNEQQLKHKVHHVCSDYLQGPWKGISAEDLKLSVVKGGFSSGLGLYKCELPVPLPENFQDRDKNVPKEVLVRFHDSNIRTDDEIVRESVTFAIMSEKNLGPKLYGVFPGGRIEQYIPSRAPDWNDFTEVNLSVAKELAKFHALQMPSKKTPMFDEDMLLSLEEYENFSKVKPVNVPDFISNGEFRKEVELMLEKIRKIDPKVVFSHNDLNTANILLLSDSRQGLEQSIRIIDYERAAYNYRTFDMAMYFLYNCFYYKPATDINNYSIDLDKYPEKSEQIKFIRVYVNQFYETKKEYKSDCEKEKEVSDIMEELEVTRFTPNLHWLALLLKEVFKPRLNLPFKDPMQMSWDFFQSVKKRF